eukprot:CAMPEP_0198367830 /NCGR_PEP_ID=MMETSP1450-20131203/155390_1 /TAXON_ID=753684 ORGANISM="Madagascaria erythrocladiodes, Strain CCMP3234" /NCGR_SAMPLE_ID=MMETSP1450 /ASSEMBLY_ACC=CAM_ASM_001115 /LENGTH=116 /DNA_ID=CAMNT_0044075321 /DNA_START=856 /DNA_END=1206 /DNA_ORIENTATION=+
MCVWHMLLPRAVVYYTDGAARVGLTLSAKPFLVEKNMSFHVGVTIRRQLALRQRNAAVDAAAPPCSPRRPLAVWLGTTAVDIGERLVALAASLLAAALSDRTFVDFSHLAGAVCPR